MNAPMHLASCRLCDAGLFDSRSDERDAPQALLMACRARDTDRAAGWVMGESKRPRPKSRVTVVALTLGAALLAGIAAGCSQSPPQSERPDPAYMVDSGSWYVREQWPHDGNPYETDHFVVYSDGAAPEARQRLGDLAEEVYAEVIREMGVDPATMFRFPADQTKIDLYANRYNVLEGGGARGYYAGVIIPSFDHEAGQEATDVGSIRVTLKHELVHVVEALLKGRFVGDLAVGDPRRMPVWFSEGVAEALSGGSTGGAPRTLDQVAALTAEFGRINPIDWRVDIPLSDLVGGEYPNYYYPMAQLAVEYLLDPKGMDKTPRDLAAVMIDMGNDVPFAAAFENHMGISESEYESRFFALMDTYLPQSEFPFEAVALAVVSLLAASIMGAVVVPGLRRSEAAFSSSSGFAAPGSTRRARVIFVAEVSIFGLVAVVVVALALFSIGFDELPRGANRTLGYVATAGYFAGCVAVLTWAMHRRGNESRPSYLLPPLVIVATIAFIQIINRVLL